MKHEKKEIMIKQRFYEVLFMAIFLILLVNVINQE